MLKDYLKTRHLSLDSGKTTLALEQEYWLLIEEMSEEDGYGDWRDWFYCCILGQSFCLSFRFVNKLYKRSDAPIIIYMLYHARASKE